MSITTNNINFASFGYYGQTPKKCDYPAILTPAKSQSNPKAPETNTEKWKRYAWTVLPLLTLIRPVGSVVTVISEMAKTAKSVNELAKHHTLYAAFQTVLSAGMIAATVIEPLSPPLRSLLLGIQLLSLAHQTVMQALRDVDRTKDVKLFIYVALNFLAMASMVSQNTSLILVFLLVQVAGAVWHAAKQFSKGKYLSAGVHVAIGTVRFSQFMKILLFPLFQALDEHPQELNKRYEDQMALRFQKTASVSHIDPREKIKEKLSAYETSIKNAGGEHFLYFKQGGPQEKLLILTAESDHNGALHPVYIAPQIDQLSQRFDVKFRTINCANDIQREIQTATQFGPVMGLIINAHGSPHSMTLLKYFYVFYNSLDANTISADLFAGLDPRCVIVLNSCNTAEGLSGIAYRVADAAKRLTYAPKNGIFDFVVTKLDPLEVSFKSRHKFPIDTKIEPPLSQNPSP